MVVVVVCDVHQSEGYGPLYAAASEDHTAIATKLLDRGAVVNAASVGDRVAFMDPVPTGPHRPPPPPPPSSCLPPYPLPHRMRT